MAKPKSYRLLEWCTVVRNCVMHRKLLPCRKMDLEVDEDEVMWNALVTLFPPSRATVLPGAPQEE